MTAGADDTRGLWRARARRFRAPEVIAGAVIVAGWAALAPLTTVGSAPLALVAVVVALTMHLGSAENGSHTLTWMTTGVTTLFVILTLSAGPERHRPLVYTAAAMTVLLHSELLRLAFARRRNADIDRSIYRGSALAIVSAGLMAAAGTGVAVVLSRPTDRNWLWMPITVGVLVVVTIGLTLLPTRRAPLPRRDRWRPGDRMPPPQLPPTNDGWGPSHEPVA